MTPRVLADDLYWIAHDDRSGKSRLHERSCALGLAAALLAELLATGHITLGEDGVLHVAGKQGPPREATAHTLLDEIAADKEAHSTRTWLQYFSAHAGQRIASRLERAGHLRPEPVGWWRKATTIYVPVDPNTAATPGAILRTQLLRRSPLDPYWAWLAGLCLAAGLDSHLLSGAPHEATAYLQHVTGGLWQPMRMLLHHTSAAIGDAALTPTI